MITRFVLAALMLGTLVALLYFRESDNGRARRAPPPNRASRPCMPS